MSAPCAMNLVPQRIETIDGSPLNVATYFASFGMGISTDINIISYFFSIAARLEERPICPVCELLFVKNDNHFRCGMNAAGNLTFEINPFFKRVPCPSHGFHTMVRDTDTERVLVGPLHITTRFEPRRPPNWEETFGSDA